MGGTEVGVTGARGDIAAGVTRSPSQLVVDTLSRGMTADLEGRYETS